MGVCRGSLFTHVPHDICLKKYVVGTGTYVVGPVSWEYAVVCFCLGISWGYVVDSICRGVSISPTSPLETRSSIYVPFQDIVYANGELMAADLNCLRGGGRNVCVLF